MRFALAILAAAVLASAPVARAHSLGDVLQLNLVRARSLGYSLLDVRQTGNPNLPPQCQSTCNPVLSAINSNCPRSQCCTASFEQQLFDCFTCLANAASSSNFTTAQATVDELYDACATLGVSLPVLTFPGENPNRPLSSVSGSAFSTASSTSSSFTSSTSHISQTTISSLASPIPTISQSTVTALPSSTPLPAAPSTSRSSARKPEGVVDLRMMMMMMIGSLIAGSLLV